MSDSTSYVCKAVGDGSIRLTEKQVFNESTTVYHMVGHRLRQAVQLVDEALVLNEENPVFEEHQQMHEEIERLQAELKRVLTVVDARHKEHAS